MKKADTELLERGVTELLPKGELQKRLQSGEKLRVKFGIDPTKPDLHLGHAVPLFKLKQFQDAGHQVVLLFGGFTATIGDPTGKNESRPPLTLEQVEENAKEYLTQAGKILDLDRVEVVNNRDWFGTMSPDRFVKLLALFTNAQLLERDMFQERIKKGQAIYCHELLYPILQGYDSVAIKADVEIGGSDQLFNMLCGRPLQEHFGQRPQCVLTVPLIEGLDGHEKMSKSLGNYIAFDEKPSEMFGKVMSIPDNLMPKYFELLTNANLEEVTPLIRTQPREAKIRLAKKIITFFHDEGAAEHAWNDFETKFVRKETPDDIPCIKIDQEMIGILELIVRVGFAKSNSEARRLVEGGGVVVNAKKIIDPKATVKLNPEGYVLKVGKRKFVSVSLG